MFVSVVCPSIFHSAKYKDSERILPIGFCNTSIGEMRWTFE